MPENGHTIGGEQRSGDSAELQRSLNEIARCLNELTNQLHGVAPGVASVDGVEETRPLMKALNAQFGDAGAEAWARALAETAPDEYFDQPPQNPGVSQNFDAAEFQRVAKLRGLQRVRHADMQTVTRDSQPCPVGRLQRFAQLF